MKSSSGSEYYKVEQLGLIEENINENLEGLKKGTREYAMVNIEKEYIVFVKNKFTEIMDELDKFRSLNVNKIDSKQWNNKRNKSLNSLEDSITELKEFNSTPKQYKKQRDKIVESADEYLAGIEEYRGATVDESSKLREQREVRSAEHFAIGSVKLIGAVDEIIGKNDI